MERELLKGNLDMLLLAIIARSPGHGYAIAASLRDQSDGAFDLAEGTIYPALHRLERKGCLVSGWEKVDGRRRRVYQITEAGSRIFVAQTETWSALHTNIRQILGGAL